MFRNFLILILVCSVSYLAVAQSQGLDLYIQQGLQNSPLLKDYANQLQLNSIDSAVINAEKKPQVNGIGMLMVAPTYNGWGYDEAITNSGNYSALASASQNIFTKKIVAPRYEALNIEKQSIANSSKLSEHDLKKGITDQYIAAYSSLNLISYTQSTYKLMKEEELLLQKFVQSGVYKQIDYLSFEIAIQSQEIQIKQLQVQYRNDLRQLNLICGINDTSYHEIIAPDIQVHLPIEKYNSPFLLQFKIDSLKNSNQKYLIDASYRPKLNWFADAGLLSSNPAMLYKNFGASFGMNFSMPIYDGKQKNLQYQKLSINESTRTNYQSFFKTQYDQHIELVKMQLIGNEQLSDQIKKQVTMSETLINASKELLNKGELSVTDFIITIKNYIDIKNQLNQSELKNLQLTNEINYWNW